VGLNDRGNGGELGIASDVKILGKKAGGGTTRAGVFGEKIDGEHRETVADENV